MVGFFPARLDLDRGDRRLLLPAVHLCRSGMKVTFQCFTPKDIMVCRCWASMCLLERRTRSVCGTAPNCSAGRCQGFSQKTQTCRKRRLWKVPFRSLGSLRSCHLDIYSEASVMKPPPLKPSYSLEIIFFYPLRMRKYCKVDSGFGWLVAFKKPSWWREEQVVVLLWPPPQSSRWSSFRGSQSASVGVKVLYLVAFSENNKNLLSPSLAVFLSVDLWSVKSRPAGQLPPANWF